jgi:hypothetical protein
MHRKGRALRRRYGRSRAGAALDKALADLHHAGKRLETAHEAAPAGAAKAIVAGLHNDLFNMTSSFRSYVAEVKRIAS